MLPRPEVIQILTHATVFVCPSVYEPMGIVNLEAMACETAVVATATGGIPEVVADGETGLLVPIDQGGDGEPHDPDAFAAALADASEPAARPTRASRPRWARPGASARSTTSPGGGSPSGRWTCTDRSWPADRGTSPGPGPGEEAQPVMKCRITLWTCWALLSPRNSTS